MMLLRRYSLVAVLGLALSLALAPEAASAVAGRFTQVAGRVDRLKQGKLPAIPVKVADQVEQGDVVRTKSLSRAQITFIDNTVITLSPESRLAIDDYRVEPGKGKRHAVLQLFQGLVQVVVSKLFQVQEPDFLVKTHTAVMGVRGTDVGIRLGPNSSSFLNFQGRTGVSSVFPEIKGEVILKDMEGTEVRRGLPPTLPFEITPEDRRLFLRQLSGPAILKGKASGAGSSALAAGAGTMALGARAPGGTSLSPAAAEIIPAGSLAFGGSLIAAVTIPPVEPPAALPSSSFTFTQVYVGLYTLTSTGSLTVGNFASSSPSVGSRSGVYPGSFTASYNFTGRWDDPSQRWNPQYTGTFDGTMRGRVSGTRGGVLQGTMSMELVDTGAGRISVSGPVTLAPSGNLSYSFSGTGVASGGATLKVPSGAMTQTARPAAR